MRYVNKFDFILENVAQARAILKRNGITYDNSIYQDILKNTKRDGYTGFVTKMVFDLGMDKDDAIEIYYKVKKDGFDVGELNKMSKEEIENLLIVEEDGDYKYIFTENHYKVFQVNTYEGILKISSPAWCLKTKSYWDNYTITKKGTQFVVIHERFVPRDGNILLTTPSNWDGERYESGSYDKMRFGVTVYPSGRMEIFDDKNIQISYNHGEISNNRYVLLLPILDKILEYYKKSIPKTKIDWEEYDQMKDTVTDIMESLKFKISFSNIAPVKNADLDDNMNDFYEKIEQESGMNKIEFLKSMNRFKEQILSDDDFISSNGYMDILVNEFLTTIGEESLASTPNITAHGHPLGGYYFNEQEIGDCVIKYGYGYQYTKYGKAGIEQGFGSVEAFYKRISDEFTTVLLDDAYVMFSLFNNSDIDNAVGGKEEFEKNLSDCMIKEEYKDGYKINLNIPKLFRLLVRLHIRHPEYVNYRYINVDFKDTKDLAEIIKEGIGRTFKVEINSDDNDIETQSVSIFICTK